MLQRCCRKIAEKSTDIFGSCTIVSGFGDKTGGNATDVLYGCMILECHGDKKARNGANNLRCRTISPYSNTELTFPSNHRRRLG